MNPVYPILGFIHLFRILTGKNIRIREVHRKLHRIQFIHIVLHSAGKKAVIHHGKPQKFTSACKVFQLLSLPVGSIRCAPGKLLTEHDEILGHKLLSPVAFLLGRLSQELLQCSKIILRIKIEGFLSIQEITEKLPGIRVAVRSLGFYHLCLAGIELLVGTPFCKSFHILTSRNLLNLRSRLAGPHGKPDFLLLKTCLAGSIITVLPLDLRLFDFRIIVDPLPDLIESAALHEGFFHAFHLLTGKIPASDLFQLDSFHLRHNDPRVGQQAEIAEIFIAEVTHGSLNLLLHAALISLI